MHNPIRPCHVCGATDRTLLYRQKFSGLSSGTFLHNYDVMACVTCGFCFADNLPQAEAFDRYYAEMSKWEFQENSGQASEMDTQRFESVARFVAGFTENHQARVLDIGCSTGGLLRAFKQQGFTQLLGLDPSPQCAKLARQNHDIDVFTGPVSTLTQLPRDCGVVSLSGVLEHLYDPNTVMLNISQRLTDGGILYICVPDAGQFAACMDAPYQQFSIEHILYFTAGSLSNLLTACGFEPIQIRTVTYPYSLRYQYPVVEAVFRKAVPAPWRRDETGIHGLQSYIGKSAAWELKIARQIGELVDRHEQLLVWGVGTNTQRLMATTRLGEANIVAFVDSNPHYHGKMLSGRPVIAPDAVRGHSATILIASIIFREEIARQVREQLQVANRLIMFDLDR